MSSLTQKDVEHVFESLRKGLVPERGIDAFAVGVEKQRGEIHRQLDMAASGEGTIKFLRGGYGCGKTFMARLAVLDAQAAGFATSFVVVSDNDLRFHRFDDVYRKVMTELGTGSCARGALGDILDRWIGRIEQSLVAAGEDDCAPDFDAKVRQRLDDDLASMTGGQAPQDFVRVIQAIFALKQQGDVSEAGALISWLCGSGNVAATAKRAAGIKGDIGSRDALDFLRGVLEIVKAAGYKGLLIVIDEAETILRMRSDSRHKSLIWHPPDRRRRWSLPRPAVDVYRDTRVLRHPARCGRPRTAARSHSLPQARAIRQLAAGPARTRPVRRRTSAVRGHAPAGAVPDGRPWAARQKDKHRVHRPSCGASHGRLQGGRRRRAAPVPARVRHADGPC